MASFPPNKGHVHRTPPTRTEARFRLGIFGERTATCSVRHTEARDEGAQNHGDGGDFLRAARAPLTEKLAHDVTCLYTCRCRGKLMMQRGGGYITCANLGPGPCDPPRRVCSGPGAKFFPGPDTRRYY